MQAAESIIEYEIKHSDFQNIFKELNSIQNFSDNQT